MTDAEAVQAFLVADDILRRKPIHPNYCRWVSIRTDERMPLGIVATGYPRGEITVYDFNSRRE